MSLRLSSAGESHGPALVAIVTGLPAGLTLDRAAIDADLARRQAGYGRSPRQQIEQDAVDVLAGLRHGRTLGTPLALVVWNRDHKNWTWGMSPWPPEGEPAGKGTKPVTLPRPGHADLAGVQKFGHDDVRERARARVGAAHSGARRCGCGREGAARRDRDHGARDDRRRGRAARAHRRGAERARHRRRDRRGARRRRAARARLVRDEGGPARRAARRRGDGDPGRQGRRDRRRVRARRRCAAPRRTTRSTRRAGGRRIAPAASRRACRTARRSSSVRR